MVVNNNRSVVVNKELSYTIHLLYLGKQNIRMALYTECDSRLPVLTYGTC